MKSNILFLMLILTGHVSAQENWKSCPTSLQAKDLETWRNNFIPAITEFRNYSQVYDQINYCFPDEKPACATDMFHYVGRLAKPNDYSMYQQEPTLNSLDQLPPEFRGANNKIVIPKNIFKLDKKKDDIMALAYKTRSTGGFDNGGNLLIIGISNPKMDIVLQIATNSKDMTDKSEAVPEYSKRKHHQGQETLTVITRDKTKNPPVGQLRQLYKSGDGYRFSNELTESSCRSCHTTPFRTISPQGYKVVHHDQKRMSPEEEKYVTDFNNKFLIPYTSWGNAERDGKVVPIGPPIDSHTLGWAPNNSRTRKEEFLKKCATSDMNLYYSGRGKYTYSFTQKNPPKINYSKLADAMDCTMCHNNTYRGKITESFSKSEVIFKILVDQSMPQTHEDMTTDEKIALVNCLYAEREELREDWRKTGAWLKSKSCTGQQFKGQMVFDKAPRPVNHVQRSTSEQ